MKNSNSNPVLMKAGTQSNALKRVSLRQSTLRFYMVFCFSLFLFFQFSFSISTLKQDNSKAPQLIFLELSKKTLELPNSLDPDEPVFKYSAIGAKDGNAFWNGKFGGRFIFMGLKSERLALVFGINGFLDLHNFTSGIYPVSWELFRANIGFNFSGRFDLVKKPVFGLKSFFEIYMNHESDHIASIDPFIKQFTIYTGKDSSRFDYYNFSSYEYLKLKLTLSQTFFNERIQFINTVGGRLFNSINPRTQRRMKYAYQLETKLLFKTFPFLDIEIGYYHERIINNFNYKQSQFKIEHNSTPYKFDIAHFGLVLYNKKGFNLMPYVEYHWRHGRGADFLAYYENWSGGLKFIL
jgi:hypothetical protein